MFSREGAEKQISLAVFREAKREALKERGRINFFQLNREI